MAESRPSRAIFSTVLAAFVRRALLEAASTPVAQALRALGFAFAIASLVFFARLVDAAPNPYLHDLGGYGGFALLGLVAADLQRSAGSSLSLRVREAQLQGNLEALLATPAPTWLVVLGTVLPDVLASLGRSLLYLLVGAVAFGVPLGRCNVGAALLALVLALLAFGALGLVAGAVTLALRRGDPLGAVIGGLSLVAGGVFYPRAVLPQWLRAVGEVLPVTPTLEALRRAVLVGDSSAALAPLFARAGLFALLVGPAGAMLFAVALRRARRDGSLSFY